MEGEFSVICGILITGGFMKKSRFSESQIVGILKESEGGIPFADILRIHGICHGIKNQVNSLHQELPLLVKYLG